MICGARPPAPYPRRAPGAPVSRRYLRLYLRQAAPCAGPPRAGFAHAARPPRPVGPLGWQGAAGASPWQPRLGGICRPRPGCRRPRPAPVCPPDLRPRLQARIPRGAVRPGRRLGGSIRPSNCPTCAVETGRDGLCRRQPAAGHRRGPHPSRCFFRVARHQAALLPHRSVVRVGIAWFGRRLTPLRMKGGRPGIDVAVQCLGFIVGRAVHCGCRSMPFDGAGRRGLPWRPRRCRIWPSHPSLPLSQPPSRLRTAAARFNPVFFPPSRSRPVPSWTKGPGGNLHTPISWEQTIRTSRAQKDCCDCLGSVLLS